VTLGARQSFLVDSSGTVRWTNFTEDIRIRARADEMLAARGAGGEGVEAEKNLQRGKLLNSGCADSAEGNLPFPTHIFLHVPRGPSPP